MAILPRMDTVIDRSIEDAQAAPRTANPKVVAVIAALAMVALVWAPWAHATIRVLGAWGPTDSLDGTYFGSDLGGIAYGWFVIIGALVALIAVLREARAVAIAAAGVAFAAVAYSAATLTSHTVTATAGGTDIGGLVGARISPAWGTWAELVAGLVLLLACLSRGHRGIDAA